MNQGTNEVFARLWEMAEKWGWSAMGVLPTSEQAAFNYTIGLTQSVKHPELLISGLTLEHASMIFESLYARIKAGERFDTEGKRKGLFERYDAYLLPITPENCREYLRAAHRTPVETVTAIQIVIPNRAGLFPWEEGGSNTKSQMLLGQPRTLH